MNNIFWLIGVIVVNIGYTVLLRTAMKLLH